MSAWFREVGYEDIYAQTLQQLGLRPGDGTALPGSLYDSQAACGKSIRLHMFKGYKLYLYASVKGVVLTHACVPACFRRPRFGSCMCAPSAAYDSREIRETAESLGFQMITAINKGRNT